MYTFSKTTLIEGFKQTSNIIFKEDGKTPYKHFTIDENLIPKESEHLEGDWEITVSFSPKKNKRVSKVCFF